MREPAPVVVLLGCWTAGKTSTVNRLKKKCPNGFLYIDSDAEVSTQWAGWTGNIFLANAQNPLKAHNYIDFRERLLLAKLLSVQQPCLLAAGPLLPTREPFWGVFVNCVKPVCFYLEVTAEEIYRGLKKRRTWQQKAGLDLCEGFGSWDDGLLTRFNSRTEAWDELEEDEALAKISTAISKLAPIYEKFSFRTIQSSKLKNDLDAQNHFDDLVAEHLSDIHKDNRIFHSFSESSAVQFPSGSSPVSLS